MISSKRLSLQLTPLLDLLLIVIFAQYLEVEQKSVAQNREQVAEQARQQHELRQTQDELRFTRQVLSATQQFRNDAEQKLAGITSQQQADRMQSEEQQQELTGRLGEVSNQRDQIALALRKIYTSSSAEVSKLLEQLSASSNAPVPLVQENVELLTRQISESGPRELTTFLLAYGEIRKRCDVWEIHIAPNGIVTLYDGDKRHALRANSAEDFQRRMFELYRSLPQTKGLVIMLISYGDVRADIRQRVLLSMPALIERMQSDSNGRTRFEYANIGYLPEAAPQSDESSR